MSGLLPSFLRSSGTQSTSNSERNGSTTTSNRRRTSAPAPLTSKDTHQEFSSEEWENRMKSTHFSRNEINQLVLNYLVIEGYKDAAEKFTKETGLKTLGELAAIDERMKIRSAIQKGDISGAINSINELNPNLLDSHPRIAFHLQQQMMIELIKLGDTDKALQWAQEELAPRAELHPEFLRDLEKSMSLLVFGEKSSGSNLTDLSHRVKIANEVNSALLAVQSQENESKLPALLMMLYQLQESMGRKSSFPKIVDFSTAKFDPPLSFVER